MEIMVNVEINTDFIKLDAFLKWCSIAQSGAEAKMFILDEMVLVNDEICTQRGRKLYKGDCVEFEDEKYTII